MRRRRSPSLAMWSTAILLAMLLACFSDRPSPTSIDDCTAVTPTASGAYDAIIVIRDYTFTNQSIRVPAGGTARWVNCDGTSHAIMTERGDWLSTTFAYGQSVSRTFATVGRVAYFCEPHPFMRGEIVVE